MPKMQSTIGQRARQDARQGTKYTNALRKHAGSCPPRRGQVLQFLARHLDEHVFAIGGITAAWAQMGLRVLILRERKYDLRVPKMQQVKGRWICEELPEPPGAYSIPHWSPTPGQGEGRLAEQDMDWYIGSGPLKDTPLREAVRHARDTFDLTVLLPDFQGDLWHPYDLADHLVAIAGVADLPRRERRLRMVGTEQVVHQPRLTPQQSAAVLRERHLKFLYQHDVAVHGLVCHGSSQARAADPAFYDAVARDMHDSGIPLLGWITSSAGLRPFRALPSRTDLENTGFVAVHNAAARQILTVLPGLCLPTV
ncbi:hypothetical protein [Streptomyces sioyaensis]|uniref:hypothetical protein n=1 Tax=Streptomyces sioyaensis TaxID=67364 RepID=UPI003D713A86